MLVYRWLSSRSSVAGSVRKGERWYTELDAEGERTGRKWKKWWTSENQQVGWGAMDPGQQQVSDSVTKPVWRELAGSSGSDVWG